MKTAAQLDAEIRESLQRDHLERVRRAAKPRAELVEAARAAAAKIFAGKKTLNEGLVGRARSAAFAAVLRADRGAGTSDHPYAAYSHDVATVAEEGVEQARHDWQLGRKRR
jgi:hypothetical protein